MSRRSAGEHFGELEDRRRHLAIAIEARDVARRVDDVREAPVSWQKCASRARAAACSRGSPWIDRRRRKGGKRYSAATRCRSASAAFAASISAAFFSTSETR